MTGHDGPASAADAPFMLCLSHDVDRIYKTVQAPYRAIVERDASHLRALATEEAPYWQFGDIMDLEDSFGVRSSFYFLQEKRLHELPIRRRVHPRNWIQFTGHYDLEAPAIREIIHRLTDGGWEVGIHGSYESFDDPDRFAYETELLEEVLDAEVRGGRQHFLQLDRPRTWRMHRDQGLRYDASLGSSTECGFHHGASPTRPFGDDFLVFPLTLMEVVLRRNDRTVQDAKRLVDRLIARAARTGAVMTVLWHVRLFNADEFPGYRELYRYLLERATAADAWIGPLDEAHACLTNRGTAPELESR